MNHKILIGTHHKTGTVWMLNIFVNICKHYSLRFINGRRKGDFKTFDNSVDVFFQYNSRFNLYALSSDFRGLHIIRDPRDVIISGCYYHQISEEEWLKIPREEFDGLSYQEKINSYSNYEDQLLFEMKSIADGKIITNINEMLCWDYNNPKFFEVRYEDLIRDVDMTLFKEIFLFLGFKKDQIKNLLDIAYDLSLFSGKKKNNHIRSGKPEQWKEHFTKRCKEEFFRLFGDTLIKLDYESNNDW
jgi:hypothetical protein